MEVGGSWREQLLIRPCRGNRGPPLHSVDPPCQFSIAAIGGADSGWHGLRSAEYSSGALTEGFAHFIAAAAFNNIDEDGIFTYYKAINPAIASDYQDLVDANYAVSLQGGTGALVREELQ